MVAEARPLQIGRSAEQPERDHPSPSLRARADGRSAVLRIMVAMAAVIATLATAITITTVGTPPKRASVIPIAHGSRLLRVLLVGDSMAGTLGVGLAKSAPASGVTLINAATVGCGVAIAWDGGWASSVFIPGPPAPPCRSASELTTAWRGLLQRYQPDVVIYANRMDTISQEVVPGSSDRMKSLLDPGFQSYLQDAMTQAVSVLASTGAHVILTTAAPTKFGLTGGPYDDPHRWTIYDSILRSVAARSSGQVSIFDLGRFFGGDGPVPVFHLTNATGVRWRCTDGLHFTEAGGVLAAPAIFGMAWGLVGEGTHAVKAGPPVPKSVANQPWGPFAAQSAVMGCAG